MPPTPSSPLHPGPGLQDPVNKTFCFGPLSTACTAPVIHCPPLCPFCVTPCQQHLPFRFPVHRLHWSCHSLSPLCPFRPSSILQTSVDPGLLITSAFYTPLPSTNPPTPLYLTHTTPPTLTHWWFST